MHHWGYNFYSFETELSTITTNMRVAYPSSYILIHSIGLLLWNFIVLKSETSDTSLSHKYEYSVSKILVNLRERGLDGRRKLKSTRPTKWSYSLGRWVPYSSISCDISLVWTWWTTTYWKQHPNCHLGPFTSIISAT